MHYTPLRYPGGKTKFAPYIMSVLEKNDMIGCDYYEIYAGGAGVALNLLFKKYCKEIYINDADYAIYAFWKIAVDRTEELIRLIEKTPINMDVWYDQQNVFQNPDGYDLLQIAFSTFFLNRTNRSGILKAGVIGGKMQTGKYKLDARFNKKNLIKRIEKIGKEASHIHVSCKDALGLISEISLEEKSNLFVYLDPPYYVKGQGLYRNFYTPEDHINIKNRLDTVKFKWLASYDNAVEIREMYKNYRLKEYTFQYSAQRKVEGKEVILFSNELVIPE